MTRGRDDEREVAHRIALERAVAAETAREATLRAARWADDQLADAGVDPTLRGVPPRLRYPRWGWRRAVRFAVEQRMLTLRHARAVARLARHRVSAELRRHQVTMTGMAFIGRRVELWAPRNAGRLVIGPWMWIGDASALRSHEGQVTVGAKVVFGRHNTVNSYLDIEIGDECLLADGVYITDFDHRFDSVELPIRRQGIVMSPTRVGSDVWIGAKATVLRGVNIGDGTVVASHAVVRQTVPPFSIVAGVPGRIVGSRLAAGMDPHEAAMMVRRGERLPADPLER